MYIYIFLTFLFLYFSHMKKMLDFTFNLVQEKSKRNKTWESKESKVQERTRCAHFLYGTMDSTDLEKHHHIYGKIFATTTFFPSLKKSNVATSCPRKLKLLYFINYLQKKICFFSLVLSEDLRNANNTRKMMPNNIISYIPSRSPFS